MIRHGQPQMGHDGLYVPNAGLTDIGHLQASRAAARVHDLRPDAAFTSNIPRAIESAEHFARISNQIVHQIPNLAELNTGNIWSAPDEFKRRIVTGDYTLDYKSIGGETITEFSGRVVNGFKQLLDQCVSSGVNRVAAFLHEGVIGTIIDHLEGRDLFDHDLRATMPYGALVTVDTESPSPHFPGQWDTDHLL